MGPVYIASEYNLPNNQLLYGAAYVFRYNNPDDDEAVEL